MSFDGYGDGHAAGCDGSDRSAGGRTDDPFDACARCGTSLDPDVRYPATSRRTTDDTTELYSFCRQACRSGWQRP